MSCEISLEGLLTVGGNEERSVADIKVYYNNNVYDWKIYIPQNVNLSEYIEQSKAKIMADIDAKEAEWEALDPKTKTIPDPHRFRGEEIVVPLEKNEIVKPNIPDYYALRRQEYPTLAEQLGAIWKGTDSAEFDEMKQKILAVKNKYPK